MAHTLIVLNGILFLLCIVYAGFFVANKIIFNKYIQCLQKYDTILGQVMNIAFTKVNALAEKNQPLKEKIGILNIARSQIVDNLNCCKQDFFIFDNQLKNFHLIYCYKLIKECTKKLQICFDDFSKFKKEFDNISQYSQIIEDTGYFYSDFICRLKNDYYSKDMRNDNLPKINDLIASASKSASKLNDYAKEDNIVTVINAIKTVQNETNALFETFNNYQQLLLAKKHMVSTYNVVLKLMADHNFETIVNRKNKKTIEINQKIYEENISAFNTKIAELDFQNAFIHLHNAFNAYNNINIFARTQLKAPRLVNKAITVLNQEISWLLNNREEVKANLLKIKRYFTCQKVITLVDEIIPNINQISLISSQIKNITPYDQNNTKQIIDELLSLWKIVLDTKNRIAIKLKDLTDFINKNIDFISRLNNLYILQYQLLVYTNELFTNQNKLECEKIVNDNLSKINWNLQLLLENNEKFNFINFSDDLITMEKTTENIIRKMHLQKTFKELATEMFVFTNRYQHKYGQKLNNAEKMYHQNDFQGCLNVLIEVCKIASC